MSRLGMGAALAAVGLGAGALEARALRRSTYELRLNGLDPRLDGVRLLHVSDVHAGYGPGLRNLRAAVDWAYELKPDLAVISGDLVARQSAEPGFRRLAAELAAVSAHGAFAVLGNHDHGAGNDPFAEGVALRLLEGARLLRAEAYGFELRGCRACLVGIDARAYLRSPRYDVAAPLDRSADLRILICHYPSVLRRLRPGDFQLVLAGHLHGGQICMPWPSGRIPLAHPRSRDTGGIEVYEGTTMHTSTGLGTTFVPLRFLARPEATLLVLRSG